MPFFANKTRQSTDLLVLTERSSVFKELQKCNESLRINAKVEFSKSKDSVIKEFDALKSPFLAEVDFFKKRHVNSYGNDTLVENSESLIKQFTRRYYVSQRAIKK